MPVPDRRLYRFGEAEVDSAKPELRLGSSIVPLRQRTFQVLLYLIDHRDRVVSREELLDALWKDTSVTEGALSQCIVDIRRALADDPKSPRFVKTYPKTGYRFLPEVMETALQAPLADVPGPVSAVDPEPPPAALVSAPPAYEVTTFALEIEEEVDEGTALAAPMPELPRRREKRWHLVAPALLLLAALIGMGILAALRRPDPELRLPELPGRTGVAVLFFENRTKSPELDWLREGLADMLIADLSRSPRLLLLSRQQLGHLVEGLGKSRQEEVDLETALEIGRRSRASALVLGTFQRIGDRVRLDVQLLESSSGRLRVAETAIAERPEQILSQVDLLAYKLAEHLGAPLPGTGSGSTLRAVRTDSLDAYRYYSLGLERAHALRSDEAIALLSKAIALDPDFAMAHARIGYALAITGNEGEKARPHFERALRLEARLSPKDRLQVLAWDAIARLDYAEATRAFERVVAEFPGEVEAYGRLGKLLHGEERSREAVEVLRRGLTIDPESAALHNILSTIDSDLGRHDEAIEEARLYVAREPGEANSHDTLGMAYQWAGRYEEALAAYDQALTVNPDFSVAVIHLGNTYAELGRRREAAKAFRRYASLGTAEWEKARGFDSLVELHVQGGDLAAADRAARENAAHEPAHGVGTLRLALARGSTDEARRLAALLLAGTSGTGRGVRPSRRPALVIEGWMQLLAGNVEEGLASLRKAIQQRPLRYALDPMETSLADACLELARLPEAIAEYERVLALNPRAPMALYRLGLALERSGRKDAAIARFREFLAVWKDADPDAPELLDARSRVK